MRIERVVEIEHPVGDMGEAARVGQIGHACLMSQFLADRDMQMTANFYVHDGGEIPAPVKF
jgi:hypothetical protein